ncbi:hypothetical protein I2W78_25840 [Streptomyces spinoverrucosus]|uniref:hypothetical protein n=1 Tax=Streptomyces spinoverrucosus TaxID=284043 RepID=UPI0018C360B3|nr:hypothetical protein [Streptomyces spinoverrucosus]MBG0855174.1 hypothetical protein [Streptomyces spinoverrucosus]
MIEQGQRQGRSPDRAWETRRRAVGGAAFFVGLVGTLAVFAFFPGLPHIIDWGAILVSLAVGAVARWGCLAWGTRRAAKKSEGM